MFSGFSSKSFLHLISLISLIYHIQNLHYIVVLLNYTSFLAHFLPKDYLFNMSNSCFWFIFLSTQYLEFLKRTRILTFFHMKYKIL